MYMYAYMRNYFFIFAGIGALGVLGVALHVAGGTAAICCHCRKAKQYASFNANLNANGVVNRNQSKMVTTQQQEAQPLLKVVCTFTQQTSYKQTFECVCK